MTTWVLQQACCPGCLHSRCWQAGARTADWLRFDGTDVNPTNARVDNSQARGRRGRMASATLVVVLLTALGVAGVGLTGMAARRPNTAAPPPTSVSSPAPGTPSATPRTLSMAKSEPRTLRIATMKVQAPIQRLGLVKGSDLVELPPQAARPGWFTKSATPGEVGIATILGYISKTRPGDGVFAHLAQLKAGQTIAVDRADGTTAVFQVDKIKSYPEGKFPGDEVFGSTKRSELRVITCGGTLKPQDRRPVNVVIFAHLIDDEDAS